tara:strand:+ start:338 stop:553 length:216 start_codon:yes stop_codon:yes gene_type:complete
MEDIINQIDGQVQIIFEKTASSINQTFRDALWMTQEEYEASSIDTINALKQARFDNWLAIVTDMFDPATPE